MVGTQFVTDHFPKTKRMCSQAWCCFFLFNPFCFVLYIIGGQVERQMDDHFFPWDLRFGLQIGFWRFSHWSSSKMELWFILTLFIRSTLTFRWHQTDLNLIWTHSRWTCCSSLSFARARKGKLVFLFRGGFRLDPFQLMVLFRQQRKKAQKVGTRRKSCAFLSCSCNAPLTANSRGSSTEEERIHQGQINKFGNVSCETLWAKYGAFLLSDGCFSQIGFAKRRASLRSPFF